MPRLQVTTVLLSLATLCVPAVAQGTNPAVRDSLSALNFVQGQVTLDGQPVTTELGSRPRPLHAGQVLATSNGSADVMLAPGALLRLAGDTTVNVIAADGHRAEVRVTQGRVNLDANMVRAEGLLLVDLPNGQAQILSPGLYTFNAETQTMRVFHGEADAFAGADTTTAVKPVAVKDEHEVTFNGSRLKPAPFAREEAGGDLLPWTGPQETQTEIADGGVSAGGGYASVGYGYGPYGGPYEFADAYPYPYYGYGYGYGYPWGFYGYPFGLGFGFGYWGGYGGFYGGGYGPRVGHGYGPGTGAGSHGFASGGFRGGSIGGGFHGGGGGHR